MPPRITVHYLVLPGTRAERIFWVLEELGLPYNVRGHARGAGGIPASLREITPLGKSPVVEIDGVVHSETGSIVHDLLAAHPAPGFERTPSAPSYFWSMFSEGTMMLHLQPSRVLSMMDAAIGKRLPPEQAKGAHALAQLFSTGWANPNVQKQLDTVDAFMEKNRFFSGTDLMGEGDLMMAYPLNTITYGLLKGQFKVGDATPWKRAEQRFSEETRKVQAQAKL